MAPQVSEREMREDVVDFLDGAADLIIRFLAQREPLSIPAAFVLNRIGREGPMRLTTLAAREGVTQPSMTQLVQRLERHGLLLRCSDPSDGRATLVAITPAGRDVMAHRRNVREERLTQLMETLTDKQQRLLWLSATSAGSVIHQLVESAEQCAAPAPAPADREVCG
ncbi:MarR family transcriptional regulator [Candidatus Mycobacterium wuenschmannii]|uniref:MarR family transcriptional regulator n=1 Tax=Candidatus Mycobacterium wuenschmannii TaxID=3027808 RepID=A0ABY8VSH7_9MYCO|nr:MarR family transcriptional regulator [Candidatus Mycobacterium wuenschmannii]WIM85896.1 MarR family transcriptional regulator [Candidatus Mycobacterium wuenschmannii]